MASPAMSSKVGALSWRNEWQTFNDKHVKLELWVGIAFCAVFRVEANGSDEGLRKVLSKNTLISLDNITSNIRVANMQ